MKYRELLALYRKGELEEEKRREVEADIEKQDAISEYLYEEAEIPGLADGSYNADSSHHTGMDDNAIRDDNSISENDSITDDAEKFVLMVQKSIRRAFLKKGLIVGAVVLMLVLGAVFVLPEVVSLFFYNPTEVVGKSEENGFVTERMSLDLSVYSEVFLPGYHRNLVDAKKKGYGVYSISIPQVASCNGRFTTVNGELVRGKLTLYNTNILRRPTGNAFIPPDSVKGSSWRAKDESTGEIIGPAGSFEEAKKALEELSENDWYIGYVSLSELMNYEAFYQWFSEKDLPYGMLWCNVYTEDEYGYIINENIGFLSGNAGISMDWNQEDYPKLCQGDGKGEFLKINDEEEMQTHFISLLSYLRDYDDIAKMLGMNYSIRYDEMIESVKRDGLRIYGFAVSVKKDALISLSEDSRVSYIYTSPLN